MIVLIAMGLGSLAALGGLAYITRNKWKPLVGGDGSQQTGGVQSPRPDVVKEPIGRLSYEHIVKCAQKAMKANEPKIRAAGGAKLVVMPNTIARDYYNVTKEKGQRFFIEEQLTQAEIEKMVVVLVSLSDSSKDILWGRVFVPDVVSDDFADFIPDDKIYVRPIRDVSGSDGLDEDGAESVARTVVLPCKSFLSDKDRNSWKVLLAACRQEALVFKDKIEMPKSGTDYILDLLDENPRLNITRVAIGTAAPLLEYLQDKEPAEAQGIDVQEIRERLKAATVNGEAWICAIAKAGEETERVADIRFLKAYQGFEQKIQDTLDQGGVYTNNVKLQ